MLAEIVKAKTILKQRAFIEAQLSSIHLFEDGDPTYSYEGHVYFENIEYFRNEGFNVERIDIDLVRAAANGRELYVFIPSHTVILSDEQLKEAEQYAKTEKLTEEDIEEILREIRNPIIGPEDYE